MKLLKFILILFLLSTLSVNCTKNDNTEGDLRYIRTLPGGCALEGLKSSENTGFENDTVTWSISGGNLDMLVGFHGTCGNQYNTSAKIKNDSIFIDITISQFGNANCLCYFTYTFQFTGINNSYPYLVNLDNSRIFTGIIKP